MLTLSRFERFSQLSEHAIRHFRALNTRALTRRSLHVLSAAQVVNTYQFIAKFLSLKGGDEEGATIQTVEHCDRFWYWLKGVGISSHRSGIANAIAEKCNTWLPGIYDSEVYADA